MAIVILPKSDATAFFLMLKYVPIKSEEELLSLPREKAVSYVKDEAVNSILSRYIKFEKAIVNRYSYSPEDIVVAVSVKNESQKPSSFYDLNVVRFLPKDKAPAITIYVRW